MDLIGGTFVPFYYVSLYKKKTTANFVIVLLTLHLFVVILGRVSFLRTELCFVFVLPFSSVKLVVFLFFLFGEPSMFVDLFLGFKILMLPQDLRFHFSACVSFFFGVSWFFSSRS